MKEIVILTVYITIYQPNMFLPNLSTRGSIQYITFKQRTTGLIYEFTFS